MRSQAGNRRSVRVDRPRSGLRDRPERLLRGARSGSRSQALRGWLFVAVMAILFGAAGALIALAVSLAAVYRPAPRKSGR